MGFAVSGLDSNQNQGTALSGLASSLEADVKAEQGFIYPHETAERSGEKELFLAPGKKFLLVVLLLKSCSCFHSSH